MSVVQSQLHTILEHMQQLEQSNLALIARLERLRNGIEFIDSHYLGLSWDDKVKKLMEIDSELAGCSEARVKQIVEQIAQEAADKRAAEDAAARVAMAARCGNAVVVQVFHMTRPGIGWRW